MHDRDRTQLRSGEDDRAVRRRRLRHPDGIRRELPGHPGADAAPGRHLPRRPARRRQPGHRLRALLGRHARRPSTGAVHRRQHRWERIGQGTRTGPGLQPQGPDRTRRKRHREVGDRTPPRQTAATARQVLHRRPGQLRQGSHRPPRRRRLGGDLRRGAPRQRRHLSRHQLLTSGRRVQPFQPAGRMGQARELHPRTGRGRTPVCAGRPGARRPERQGVHRQGRRRSREGPDSRPGSGRWWWHEPATNSRRSPSSSNRT